MNSVMTLKWLEMHGLSNRRTHVDERVDREVKSLRLVRENACLTQDNTRLRSDYEDLAASTAMWIRLYEAALERANAATAECIRLSKPVLQ